MSVLKVPRGGRFSEDSTTRFVVQADAFVEDGVESLRRGIGTEFALNRTMTNASRKPEAITIVAMVVGAAAVLLLAHFILGF